MLLLKIFPLMHAAAKSLFTLNNVVAVLNSLKLHLNVVC